MTPEDKDLARTALEKGWMTIEQVTACKVECEGTSRSFREIAQSRGWLEPESGKPRPVAVAPPPAPRPASPLAAQYTVFLGIAFGGTLFLSVIALVVWVVQERRHKMESALAAKEANLRRSETTLAVQEKLEEQKRREAVKARDEARQKLKDAETAIMEGREEESKLLLRDASTGFTTYLMIVPRDGPAHVERARVHELRGALPEAVADLERAVQLDPSLKTGLDPRISILRKALPRRD